MGKLINAAAPNGHGTATPTSEAEKRKTEKRILSGKLPLHVLPSRIQEAIQTYANVHECPLDLPFCAMLAAAAMPTAKAFTYLDVDGREKTCNLALIVCAPSNTGKSTVFDTWAFQVAERWNAKWRAEYKAKLADWKATPEDERPLEPVQRMAYLETCTPEYLRSHFGEGNYFSLHVDEVKDEIRRWTKGGYSGLPYIGMMMNLADGKLGASASKKDGVYMSDPGYFIPFTFTAGIQPEYIDEIFADGKGTTGFAGRFLYCFQPDLKFKESHRRRIMEAQATLSLIDAPLGVLFGFADLAKETGARQCLTFAPDALDYLDGCTRAHFDAVVNDEDQSDAFRACLPKLLPYKWRFALLIECLNAACSRDGYSRVISLESAKAAHALIDYFEGHLRAVTDYLDAQSPADGAGGVKLGWHLDCWLGLPAEELGKKALNEHIKEFAKAKGVGNPDDAMTRCKRALIANGLLLETKTGYIKKGAGNAQGA